MGVYVELGTNFLIFLRKSTTGNTIFKISYFEPRVFVVNYNHHRIWNFSITYTADDPWTILFKISQLFKFT